MFWSTGILLLAKDRDWIKIAIGLLECCRTPRVLRRRDCNQDIDVAPSQSSKISLCGSCRRVLVVSPRWTCWSPAFDSCLQETVPYADFSRTSQLTLWRYFVAVHPAVSPLRSIYKVFFGQQCCFGFPRSSPRSSPRLVAIPRMILILVQIDLVNHIAN